MSNDSLSMPTEDGRRASAGPALVASPSSPQAVSTEGFDQAQGFLLKRWVVSVQGYGEGRYVASNRGTAIAEAWRSDAFSHLTFGQFLKIVTCRRDGRSGLDYGDPITVDGKAAFYVERNRAYVTFAYPGDKRTRIAHPYDVLPERYRPESYRTASVDTHPKGGDGEAAPFMSGAVGEAETPNLNQDHPHVR